MNWINLGTLQCAAEENCLSKSAYLTEWYNQQYWDPYRTRKLLRFSVSKKRKKTTVKHFLFRQECGIEEQLIFCRNRLEINGNGMLVMLIITRWKTLLIMIF